jgi:ribokinase
MSRPIVVVGSVNLDLVCTASKIPSRGETVWGDRFQTFHGGKGANQAVAASRLGNSVHMVAKVGDDDFGKRLREGLAAASVNIDHVSVAAGVASGVALISVDANGQNSIIVVPGANAELRPEDLDRILPKLQSAGIILAQLETPMDTVEYLSQVAQRAGVPLMLDPAPARPLPESILRRVTYLTPNETETAALCDLGDQELAPAKVPEAAEALLRKGAENVVLKLGSRGAFLASRSGIRKMFPAIDVRAVDSTAAGDAFNGGMASALMQGLTLEDAVGFAVAVAAVSVTRPGAQPSMPNAAEVAELLQKNRREVKAPLASSSSR